MALPEVVCYHEAGHVVLRFLRKVSIEMVHLWPTVKRIAGRLMAKVKEAAKLDEQRDRKVDVCGDMLQEWFVEKGAGP